MENQNGVEKDIDSLNDMPEKQKSPLPIIALVLGILPIIFAPFAVRSLLSFNGIALILYIGSVLGLGFQEQKSRLPIIALIFSFANIWGAPIWGLIYWIKISRVSPYRGIKRTSRERAQRRQHTVKMDFRSKIVGLHRLCTQWEKETGAIQYLCVQKSNRIFVVVVFQS